MRNILHDLFCGEIFPCERKPAKSPERDALHQKTEDEMRYFTDKMSACDRERFLELRELYNESYGFEELDTFVYAFKLGVMLMVAVFTDEPV